MSPIPLPTDFEGYKRVDPTFPERILHQFEEDSRTNRELQRDEQVATIELSKKRLDADIAFEKRSQWMTYSVMVIGLLGTFVLAYLDKDVAAAATGISTLLMIFKGIFGKPPPKDNSKTEN